MSEISAIPQMSAAAPYGEARSAAPSPAPGPSDSVAISDQAAALDRLARELATEGGYDEASALLFTRIIEKTTGRTVHQIPRQELLDLYARFKEFSPR